MAAAAGVDLDEAGPNVVRHWTRKAENEAAKAARKNKPPRQDLALAENRLAEKAKKPGRPPTTTRDVALVLQQRELTKAAPAVLQRLIAIATDPADENHWDALKLIVERVAPQRFWNAVSDRELGVEAEGGSGPRVVLNVILPEQRQQAETIDVQPTIRVQSIER